MMQGQSPFRSLGHVNMGHVCCTTSIHHQKQNHSQQNYNQQNYNQQRPHLNLHQHQQQHQHQQLHQHLQTNRANFGGRQSQTPTPTFNPFPSQSTSVSLSGFKRTRADDEQVSEPNQKRFRTVEEQKVQLEHQRALSITTKKRQRACYEEGSQQKRGRTNEYRDGDEYGQQDRNSLGLFRVSTPEVLGF